MPSRGGHGAPAGRGWPPYLVSGLFCCLVLGLVLSPTPFLSSSSSSSGGRGGGGSNGGHGGGGEEEEELSLLLRGKQTQRVAGASHPHAGGGGNGGVELVVAGGQPASTEGLLRYFAEARREVRFRGWAGLWICASCHVSSASDEIGDALTSDH